MNMGTKSAGLLGDGIYKMSHHWYNIIVQFDDLYFKNPDDSMLLLRDLDGACPESFEMELNNITVAFAIVNNDITLISILSSTNISIAPFLDQDNIEAEIGEIIEDLVLFDHGQRCLDLEELEKSFGFKKITA